MQYVRSNHEHSVASFLAIQGKMPRWQVDKEAFWIIENLTICQSCVTSSSEIFVNFVF